MINVSKPYIAINSSKYVNTAISLGEVSGVYGSFIDQFEKRFSSLIGTEYGVACCNGTTALHLAIDALDLQPEDEVLVSALTNMATFFAVHYTGAIPVS